MQRRDFLKLAGSTIFVTPLVENIFAGPDMKLESAFKVPIGQPLADPFCMAAEDGYYLTGTHFSGRLAQAEYMFDLFHSKDLITWTRMDRMLKIPEYEGSRQANYWAPEILNHQGKYYLYYTADSFGNPERRFVRVAVADKIGGPYEDCGVTLTEQASIDGDPFYVSEDEGYLFYTGNEGNRDMGQLLMDRLVTPTQLERKPKKVFPDETVGWEEGGFAVRRAGQYFVFSSQGNWRNETYHVLVAKSGNILGPYQRCRTGEENCRVLSTHEDQLGPGHNSVFIGPDSRYFICYHAWDPARTGRYTWIAPLDWDGGFPRGKQ